MVAINTTAVDMSNILGSQQPSGNQSMPSNSLGGLFDGSSAPRSSGGGFGSSSTGLGRFGGGNGLYGTSLHGSSSWTPPSSADGPFGRPATTCGGTSTSPYRPATVGDVQAGFEEVKQMILALHGEVMKYHNGSENRHASPASGGSGDIKPESQVNARQTIVQAMFVSPPCRKETFKVNN
jgi:hypothetical protein